MPSTRTDEERRAKYGELRDQKKRLEKVYSICGFVTLGLALFIVIPSLFSGALHGMFLFQTEPLFEAFLIFAMFACQIIGIYRRNWIITMAGLICMIFADCTVDQLTGIPQILPFFSSCNLILTILVFVCQWKWEKISREEGFPDFDIDYVEREQQRKTAERLHENKMLSEGAVRGNVTAGDMTDLLDKEQKILPAELSGYKDRSALIGKAGAKQYAPGEMDEL